MPRFAVAITYKPIPLPHEGDDLGLYDPPAHPDQPLDPERVYKTFTNARSEREAFKKVLISRREVEVEKRMYSHTVCHHLVKRI